MSYLERGLVRPGSGWSVQMVYIWNEWWSETILEVYSWGTRAVLLHILSWPKSSFSFLHNILLLSTPIFVPSELYHTRPMDVRDTCWEGGGDDDDQSQADKDLVQEDSAHTDDQGNLQAGWIVGYQGTVGRPRLKQDKLRKWTAYIVAAETVCKRGPSAPFRAFTCFLLNQVLMVRGSTLGHPLFSSSSRGRKGTVAGVGCEPIQCFMWLNIYK